MTYSIKVRGPTRAECKRRITEALEIQTRGQSGHMLDRVHVERLLHALVDQCKEQDEHDVVCDAYGYVSIAGDGTPAIIASNAKVYMAQRIPDVPIGNVYRKRLASGEDKQDEGEGETV